MWSHGSLGINMCTRKETVLMLKDNYTGVNCCKTTNTMPIKYQNVLYTDVDFPGVILWQSGTYTFCFVKRYLY